MEPEMMVLPGMFVIIAITFIVRFFKRKSGNIIKDIYNKSKKKALKNELNCLHKMLKQITEDKFILHERFDIPHVESISYLNTRIYNIFIKKMKIIEHYATISNQEIQTLTQDSLSHKKIAIHRELNIENDKIIASLDKDILQLQARRTLQWNSDKESINYLIEQEIFRNNYINSMYKRYRALLEKVYAHIETHPADFDMLSIDFFKPSASIDFKHISMEKNHRLMVRNFENIINNKNYMEHA